MKLSDLKLVIEFPRGSYKKFADTLEEYPVLGVTFPTHYGYIDGYASEDGHDLDIFIGSGNEYGLLRVKRDDVPGGIETKFIALIMDDEFNAIESAYRPVIHELKKVSQEEFFNTIQKFRREEFV